VLRRYLPAAGSVLELASGSGEHVEHFAAALPHLVFQPSDPDPAARASIAARVQQGGLKNVRAPLDLGADATDWRLPAEISASLAAILCINMIHISPWRATVGLLRNAGAVLASTGLLYCYGPYRRGGRHTAPSNEAFDRDLRSRNPDWGVRDLEDVIAEAASREMELVEIVEMPANNLSVVLRRM
jgi:SAM-dependent methyltransferase